MSTTLLLIELVKNKERELNNYPICCTVLVCWLYWGIGLLAVLGYCSVGVFLAH